jgi:anti-sigma-K factor RskA
VTETTQAPATPCHAGRWRAATIFCLLVIAFGAATGMSMFEQFKAQMSHLQKQLQTTPQIKFLSVLLDEKQTPALLVTFDPQDTALQVQRLNDVKEGREDTMQLWALRANQPPRSLGMLVSSGKTLRLPVDQLALTDVTQLAISVESKGGVTQEAGPRLPYLFTGAVVQKAL